MMSTFRATLFSIMLTVFAGATPVRAAPAMPERLSDVQRSGEIFHARACPEPQQPGLARCHARIVTDAEGRPIELVASSAPPRGYSPASLQAAYKVDPTSGSQTTVVAVVDAYGYPNAESDLAVYRATFGLPACTSANGCFAVYNQSGTKSGFPAPVLGWEKETALDLNMVSAMCPNCRIVLVEANSAYLTDLAASVNTAASLGAHVITSSYGGSESGTQSFESSYNHPGVAVTVSTGDVGYGVEFPASSPHVIATGGTSLRLANGTARGWTETAWRYGGSGCSAIYPKPSWQTDIRCTHRMEADVSAVSDPSTGVAVYAPASQGGSAWQVFGGTSVAAPLIGGVYGANGGSVHGGDTYNNRSALFDIVTGSNGSCGGIYFCIAQPGYDGPTGLGSPNGTSAF